MTVFIVIGTLMVLLAIGLLVVPLIRPMPAVTPDEPAASRAAPVAFALAVIVGLGAAGLYSQVNTFPWNNPTAVEPVPAGHGAMGADDSTVQVLVALETRLQKDPNDREGWRMLGRTYLVSGNAVKAAAAYERANALSPEKDMPLLLDLAEALVLTDDPAMQVRAQAILDETLAADDRNPKALWYHGVMAVRAGDNETAKRDWSRLLESNPPPEIREIIASQLQSLDTNGPAVAVGPGSGDRGEVAAQGRSIGISVKIDPSLAGRLKPGVPLFVAAREPGIPGPPVAAIRIMSEDLPAQVVLSDSNAMIEGRTLSSVDDVEIVARVAFGGTATTASGDLIGRALVKKGVDQSIDVLINQVQP